MRISGVTYAVRKKRKSSIILKLFIIVLLSVFIISIGLCTYTGWTLTHPPRKALTYDTTKIPKYKDVTFKDIKDNIALKGWYFKSGTHDRTVILVHGYKSNRLQFDANTFDMVNDFIYNGYNMLLFDFRACGKSGGSTSSVGLFEQDDLLGAIKYVKDQGAKKIILLGVSMGASTSIITASKSKDVTAVIADTPFSNLEEYLNDNLAKWTKPLPAIFNKPILIATRLFSGADPGKVSVTAALNGLSPRPLLLIHSANDETIPISNSNQIYKDYKKIAGDKVQLWETNSTKHARSFKEYPKEYMTKVYDFLNKY